ncbi:NADH-dependent glutamate synthase 1 [Saprolegnia diclina VS20]|uniref:NADH-dependent glutamate synthase 1 n=1 Tax=Saprolegnia diclina (strain VS20) TaxID=1156394 RepID=T0Q723_SAPDV|nr:NADH-dependent glutamate synthase 1 [Saprolegnia diclina VS20]EQC29280.1 NADH-dependent glutamate synthase 1 [Saprolegnia diclina VS20]|eukprot:XP_008617254.1 NADH-dependent glutamate synthase 1 [Saprolegnia diclina VS20]
MLRPVTATTKRVLTRLSARALSAKPFIDITRSPDAYRPAKARVHDWNEIYTHDRDPTERTNQASRCMDCGTPFCQSRSLSGCPVANLIPEWNALVVRDEWREAYTRLSATNNFPEFTGRVCPAPCEGACVLGVIDNPVTIKNVEHAIVARAWDEGWIVPRIPAQRSGLKVGVVGSGPAGLAAADQLNQLGHSVVVFEKADRIGGLLMYGIPNMKLDKSDVERRVDMLAKEGIEFRTSVHVGENIQSLMDDMDAVVLATGSTVPRFLTVEGANLGGIHFAMEFLTRNQKRLLATKEGTLKSKWHKDYISAEGKHVVVIGGGDTGTDCIATSLRQQCKSITNLEHNPKPPATRAPSNPWPQYPRVYHADYGHEEAAEVFGTDPRAYSRTTLRFRGNASGQVTHVVTAMAARNASGGFDVVPGTEEELPCDLAILAMGFMHPDQALPSTLDLAIDGRKNIATDGNFATSMPGVFAAGDCRRGQSLVVWAIHEGRQVADAVQQYFNKLELLAHQHDAQHEQRM